jgi:hypothetical protein
MKMWREVYCPTCSIFHDPLSIKIDNPDNKTICNHCGQDLWVVPARAVGHLESMSLLGLLFLLATPLIIVAALIDLVGATRIIFVAALSLLMIVFILPPLVLASHQLLFAKASKSRTPDTRILMLSKAKEYLAKPFWRRCLEHYQHTVKIALWPFVVMLGIVILLLILLIIRGVLMAH